MAGETWEQRARARWEQLTLFPPESTRIDYTVFLPSDASKGVVGWRVSTWPDGEIKEIEVTYGIGLALIPEIAGRDVTNLVRRYRDDLPPFR